MVNINNRQEVNELLNKLNSDTPALWGMMQPQHMIEHLAKIHRYTNGKMQASLKFTEEEAQRAKQVIIYSDVEISKGLKSPLEKDVPGAFEYANMQEAINVLNKEMDDFENYFDEHPAATFIQPRLGSLNREEWIIFHNKHFTHHFKQFGLI